MNFIVFFCLLSAGILSLFLGAWGVVKLLDRLGLEDYFTPALLVYFIMTFLGVAYGAYK